MGDRPSPSPRVGDPPSLGVGDLPNSAVGGPIRQAWAFLRRWAWVNRRMRLASIRSQGLESGLASIVPGLAWRLERPAGVRQGPDSAQTALECPTCSYRTAAASQTVVVATEPTRGEGAVTAASAVRAWAISRNGGERVGDLPKERPQTDPSGINPLEARLVRRHERGRLCVGVRAPGEMRHNPGQLERKGDRQSTAGPRHPVPPRRPVTL